MSTQSAYKKIYWHKLSLSFWICLFLLVPNAAAWSAENNDGSQNMSNASININAATLDQLQTLEGIGQSKAQAIIDYRELQGQFAAIEDIQTVPGIGPSIYEKNKSRIRVQ
ncbi:ComEA family DNA-binding protein [Alginatibacterium sediminis]|uniref:ComEA family DNA-binding protein n=1 Tax=Alginatibacterium sediminis TaxID=2164068 RepID=A0A420E818_9ALTE|nr:ComEA family DNA-binding protein [Alginatibacterium sediminis]RKF15520.1 ComEA family DNA-binding protein [Alginatibacterium sediminis]